MYIRWVIGGALVALIIGLAGCGNSPVAIVNGERLTEKEFGERLVRNAGRETPQDMIDRQLLRHLAEDAGITVSEEELNKEAEQTKKQFRSPDEFESLLKQRNMTEEEWLDALRMAMMVRELQLKDVKYTDAELKKFYEQYRDQYALPTRVTISEIVVSTEKEAREVLAELKKDAGKFADLARIYSQAPYTRERGGKRPEERLDRVNPDAVQKAAGSLAVGKIGEPIAADGQWYIIKVDDRQAAREASWEQDKERVKRDYEGRNMKPLGALLQEAIKKGDVQILDPRFQELNEVYTAIPDKIPEFGPEAPQGAPGTQEPAEPAPPNAADDSR